MSINVKLVKKMMNEHKDFILNYSKDKLGQRKNI